MTSLSLLAGRSSTGGARELCQRVSNSIKFIFIIIFLIDEGREGLNTTKSQLSSACQQITIEMAFHCRADAGPILKAYLETL